MAKNKTKRPLCKVSAVVLFVAMLIGVLLSAWFFVSPSLDMKSRLDEQNRLLLSIEQGNGMVAVAQRNDITQADYHDASTDTHYITGIGILTIDVIGLRLPVAEGVSEAHINVAAGHVPQTAAIGELGNAVIIGHRSYEYGLFFNRLGELKHDDIVEYQPIDGTPLRFEVYEILQVEPDDQSAFFQPADESIITLYTCTPINEATHRLLVRARLIS